MNEPDVVVGIGGAAGDGVASAGNTLALSVARQGQAVYAYNSYQSVIRGGHSWLRLRISAKKPLNHGDQVDALVALNQDTLDRHLQELVAGGAVLYNSAKLQPAYAAPPGVQLCPLPVPDLTPAYRDLPVMQNTVAVGAVIHLMGLDFKGLESVLESTFAKKPQVVKTNVEAARAGYDYAVAHFTPLAKQLHATSQRWALVTGNELMAMGAAFAGCKFYCAYPMSPATHILEWLTAHAKELGICVRQVEDEISVINMAIGASHMGVRALCATSGGGFALMTEAVGLSGMLETPVVVVNVQRAGPSTGVPTKTEQADLNQAFGASQGDFPRIIMAPLSMPDCFAMPALAFNVADRYQCPVIILSDLLMGEGNETVDPALLDVDFEIDRGELITSPDGRGAAREPYLRYKDTPSGISPRAVPGVPGYLHVAASDEHDEDGVLISDVYTDTVRRKKMADKRSRKMADVLKHLPAPTLVGPADADVTLVGWGSTWGVISEAVERLNREGISANHLQIKFLVPFHVAEITAALSRSRKIIVVENNQSGQFARHLRAETGITAHGHIRKYDGEPFEPKHVVAGAREILERGTAVVEVLSTEPGWQTEHPTGTAGDWTGRAVATAHTSSVAT
ncbi:MAG: 2-oxoacid:acceptor oxidoreductase subunit alpha [Acidobacteria bacterium]|nr:2-oxoacid:acceptor oxidoreductase subunit alpha [Acidobacteriota bacterium]